MKLKALSSVAVWFAIAFSNVGASLTLSTVMAKVSLTVAPALSVAVTLTFKLPTSPLSGVPLKVRVLGLKLNQVGNGLPSDSIAV